MGTLSQKPGHSFDGSIASMGLRVSGRTTTNWSLGQNLLLYFEAVEKLFFTKTAKIKIASGSSIGDLLESQDILYPRKFGHFEIKTEFFNSHSRLHSVENPLLDSSHGRNLVNGCDSDLVAEPCGGLGPASGHVSFFLGDRLRGLAR